MNKDRYNGELGPTTTKADGAQRMVQKFYTCHKHGWDALGKPCPKCTGGDAPKDCIIHGWSHMNKGCPECAAGR